MNEVQRLLTIVYSIIASGIVALVMAFFISNEVNNGVEETQAELTVQQVRSVEELVDGCVRNGISRTERFNTAIFAESNSAYMASQEDDPEIRAGWVDAKKSAMERQDDLTREAERIGFRLPGSVMNDCEMVVMTP